MVGEKALERALVSGWAQWVSVHLWEGQVGEMLAGASVLTGEGLCDV